MPHFLYFLLYAFYFGAFIFLVSRWKFFSIANLSRVKFIAIFALKVWAGLVLTLVYTYYYTDPSKADIYRYFRDSKIISSLLFSNPGIWAKIIFSFGPLNPQTLQYIANTLHYSHPKGDIITNNSLIIRVISLLNYFSGYNIYVDTLLLDFIGLIGLTALFKSLQSFFKEQESILCIPVFLIPSVVFWSSGLLKEALLLPALGFFIASALSITGSFRPIQLFVLILAFMTIALIKVHVALLLLVCSPLLFLAGKETLRRQNSYWLLAVFYATVVILAIYFEGGRLCTEIISRRNQFIQLAIQENAGSLLSSSVALPDCGSLLSLIPSAFVTAFLRPFVWEHGNALQLLFGFENLALIIATILLPILFFRKPDPSKLWLVIFCFAFALLNDTVIGLTVPVLGAVVHYRVIATPFLFVGALLLTDLNRLERALPKFN